MNNETIQKSWMRRHPVWTAVGIFFLFVCAGTFANNNQSPTPVATKVEETKPAPTLTFEDKVKALASKSLVTMNYVGLDDEKAENGTSRMLTVKMNITSIFSAGSFYRGTSKTASGIFQETFTSRPDASDVIIWFNSDTTDKYGQKNNKLVVSYVMDRKTYDKISWDNFDVSKLCEFLQSEYKASNGEASCNKIIEVK